YRRGCILPSNNTSKHIRTTLNEVYLQVLAWDGLACRPFYRARVHSLTGHPLACMGQLTYSSVQVKGSMRSVHRSRVHNVVMLPPEIVIIISEELLTMRRTSELAALSLLGKSYARAIQPMLFHQINIGSYGRYARLMRALQSGGNSPERCYELASMVRYLSVDLSRPPPQGESPLQPCHFFNLCDNLPTLEFVELTETPMRALGRRLVPDDEDLDFLATLTSLRSITFTGPLGSVGESMVIGLPCLRELHLSGDIPASLISNAHPRSSHSLRRLTWGATTPPTLRWIRWVFGESEERVEGEIRLSAPPNYEGELGAIRQYARQRGMAIQVAGSIVG
ncbi:unnamed protein product, partial [Rhizoctonia solani]